MDRIFTIKGDSLYIMEVSALKEFKNIEEAEANCQGVIEYYISGDVIPDDYIRSLEKKKQLLAAFIFDKYNKRRYTERENAKIQKRIDWGVKGVQ